MSAETCKRGVRDQRTSGDRACGSTFGQTSDPEKHIRFPLHTHLNVAARKW